MLTPRLRQFRHAVEVGLRLVALRLLRLDARIERLHLQRELLVGDHRDFGARRDGVALLDRQRGDRAADARARDELMNRLDGRDHRFAVDDIGEWTTNSSPASA